MKKIFALLLAAALCLPACAAVEADAPGEAETGLSGPVEAVEPAPVSQPVPVDILSLKLDYELYISDEPIQIVDGCIVMDRLPVYFINNTGEDAYVLDIPHLEKLDEDGAWNEVPYKDGIGFCGTPSTLPAQGREWSEDISMLWGSLEDGRYRLSYDVGPTFDTEETICGEFVLCTPENDAGLPLAPQE